VRDVTECISSCFSYKSRGEQHLLSIVSVLYVQSHLSESASAKHIEYFGCLFRSRTARKAEEHKTVTFGFYIEGFGIVVKTEERR
jgi:hypothetical protein